MTKAQFLLFTTTLLLLAGCKKKYDPFHSKAKWIKQYFEELDKSDYDNIYAISWWHEDFDKSFLKINSSRRSLKAYKKQIANENLLTNCQFESNKLKAIEGNMYHSAYPDFGGTEDQVVTSKITGFQDLVEKDIAWAYFSNNWDDSLEFPSEAMSTIVSTGKTPFLRLLSRSDFDILPDPKYQLLDIVNGDYDQELISWAQKAAALEYPFLVEFGTEVNGDWFPWNGSYSGEGNLTGYGDPNYPDGPEIFRDAYRHIIDICNTNGANNITWFFHLDAYDSPEEIWNEPSSYYPGDNYIDWIGVSTYGPQSKGDEYIRPDELLPHALEQLEKVSTNKPYAILEFGITEL